MEKTKLGVSENIEAAIAYSFPPLAGITGFIMLVLEKENKFVRFHAMQSFMVFVLFGFVTAVVSLIPFLGRSLSGLMGIIVFVSWVLLITGAYRGKYFKFPFVGDVIYEKIVGGGE